MKRALAILLVMICAGWTHGLAPLVFQLPLKIGAGGWLVGIDVNADGTRLARTDTYGAYIWQPSSSCTYGDGVIPAPCWQQLMTQSSFPAAYFGYVGTGTSQVKYNGIANPVAGGGSGAAYEVTSAPSNSSIIYMMVNGWIFKSTNKGVTFSVTGSQTGSSADFNSATIPVTMGSNSTSRQCGRKMAIDPINTSIVYAGSDINGLFVTSNAGGLWSAVSGVPTGTGVVNYSIAFDPTSGSGGTTQTIYAATNGATAGVYESLDAGATWNLTSGGPSTVCHMIVDQTGVVWATDGVNGSANGSLWRRSSGTWVKLTAAGTQLHSVAVDPTNAAHVVAVSGGGIPATTVNGTAATPTWAASASIIRSASDVPWLSVVNEYFMSNGDTIFDPSNCSGGAGSCSLIMGEGIGVWTSNPPNSTAQLTWTSASAGIEQLVSRDVIAPNGVAITGVSDRSTWYLPTPNVYPSNYVADYFNSFSLNVTWGLDFAVGTPSFLASVTGDINALTPLNNNSGFSTDGGATWQPFNSYIQDVPASAISNDGTGQAMIAVSSVAGLSNWSATGNAPNGSSGTLVKVIPYNPSINSCNVNAVPNVTLRKWWPITLSGSNIILNGSVFSGLTTICGRLQITVDTNPLTDNNGNFTITSIASNGGLIRVTVNSTSGSNFVGTQICISGVTGTTEANGCWQSGAQGTNSFDLVGSTFTNAYISGGVATKYLPVGGGIAVSTPLNMIIIGGNNDYPYCTADGGLTWTKLAVPTGLGIGVSTGWVNASFLNRRILAADRVIANKFYMYNSNAGIGTYTVNNCTVSGPTGTVVGNSNANATYKPVPGYAGHLFFAIGSQGANGPAVFHPQGGALRRTTDGGATFQSIATTAEPIAIGIGAIAPGSDYPTIYMLGWISNVYGIWRTTATAAQWASGTGTGTSVVWTKVADYPLGSQDGPTTMAADQLTWNKWYMGWGGSGFTYGQQN